MLIKLIWGTMAFLFLTGGCSHKDSYFGVENRAIIVPKEFDLTEAAIEKAEKSPGAKYWPEKIAQAKELARRGVELYWEEHCLGCRDQQSMVDLAAARKLAHEVESCLTLAPPPEAPAIVRRPVTPPPPEAPAIVQVPVPAPPPEAPAIVQVPVTPPPPEAPAIVQVPVPAPPPEAAVMVQVPVTPPPPEAPAIVQVPVTPPPPEAAVMVQMPITERPKFVPIVQQTTSEPRVIVAGKINFAFDSFGLTLKAQAVLDKQVAILKKHPKITVEVGGHTDRIGTRSYNQALSERRAKSVKICMVSKGGSPDQLKTVGYGETRPIAPNDTRKGRAKNRRVELKVIETSSSSESNYLVEDMQKIKIKVLSGDGNLGSAKEMAKKLRNMGYKIEFIDHAPRSSFRQNTVFFTPKFQCEATRLVSSLGSNTIVTPLSWYSVFDLIIVTGKNS
jgi:outer membrane protein OmpA-like peptidoglycan-associated protein